VKYLGLKQNNCLGMIQARLMERTPSMSDLNEVMYGQVSHCLAVVGNRPFPCRFQHVCGLFAFPKVPILSKTPRKCGHLMILRYLVGLVFNYVS
jgi:hypothetical protein